MSHVVWSSCTAHTAAMNRLPPGTDPEQARRVFDAFGYLREKLEAARPDVLVVVGTDHFMTFSYEGVPTFAIGTGTSFASWGEDGAPNRTFKGIGDFGDEVLKGMVEGDFDILAVDEMRIDHAFATPLGFLLADTDVPILPIYVNCTVKPLPRLARCRAFGNRLGEVLRKQTAAERVAILGTGGLSHWIGLPKTGEINAEFDKNFLDKFVAGDFETLYSLDSDWVIEEAGNGAAEIRNWLITAQAARSKSGRQLAYEPVKAWKTGIGLVELQT
jgi:hypothetical protein